MNDASKSTATARIASGRWKDLAALAIALFLMLLGLVGSTIAAFEGIDMPADLKAKFDMLFSFGFGTLAGLAATRKGKVSDEG